MLGKEGKKLQLEQSEGEKHEVSPDDFFNPFSTTHAFLCVVKVKELVYHLLNDLAHIRTNLDSFTEVVQKSAWK